MEFLIELGTDKGASVYELGGVVFLISELCAYSATYSSYDAKNKSFALVGVREGLHRA